MSPYQLPDIDMDPDPMYELVEPEGFANYLWTFGPYEIEWEYIGEGHYGDYDPTNNKDEPLLRASLSYGGNPCIDGSYCTLATTRTPAHLLDESCLMLISTLLTKGFVRDDPPNSEIPFSDHIMQEWTWVEYDIAGDRIVIPRNGSFKYYKYVR